MAESVKERLRAVEARIAAAADRTGRNPGEILLVAVTKTISPARINEAIEAGVTAIGENRVQEARDKFDEVREGPVRHLIGHLQRNKAGRAVELFDRIDSIDSVRLAGAVSRRAEALGRTIPVLVEVNVSGEASKSGLAPDVLRAVLEEIAPLEGIKVEGLMTIGPLTDDREEIRSAFRRLREGAEEINARPITGIEIKHLSMGMSGDFEIGIEEGATIVRVGSAIFGQRA